MKLLMCLRDPLPPTRADVAQLFDQHLRGLGIETDFAGPVSGASAHCAGAVFDAGSRSAPSFGWRLARLVWRHAADHDLVVVRDLPLAALPVVLACKLRRVPWCVWTSFPMALGDRLGARDHWTAGRRVRAAATWLRGTLAQWVEERVVLPRAPHVFVQSDAMREQVLGRVRALRTVAVTAVPMGVDAASLPPASPDFDADTVAYLGTLDAARRLDVLVDAFARVRAARPGARLLLVGGAPREADVERLREQARRLGVLDAITFTGALPMQQAWRAVGRAAVAVSPIVPGPLHDVSSPTKVVEYLSLGLPVVASDIPDQRRLLADCGGGPCVPFDPAAIAGALLHVLADPAAAREAAGRARAAVLALRGYDAIAARVAGVLHGLAPAPGAPLALERPWQQS